MSPAWLRRWCIIVVDFLFGTLVAIPLSITLAKRALKRANATAWNESNIPRLDGKVAVITGANAGIGYCTAKQLALHGAKVYLAARSEKRVTEAIRRLQDENPSIPAGNLEWLPLNLESQASVVHAAHELRAKESRLDILVNNAGVDPYEYIRTSDGFELTMAVNHVGHWTLTYHLLPLLRATASQANSDVRVVTLSSSAERNASKVNDFTSPNDLDDPGASPGWEASSLAKLKRYATSKRANILFSLELQRRVDEEKTRITSICVNPGPVKTLGAADAMPYMVRPFVALFTPVAEGSLGTLFAATADDVKNHREFFKGRYLDHGSMRVIKPPSPRSQDEVAARNLWTTTMSAVGALGLLDTA